MSDAPRPRRFMLRRSYLFGELEEVVASLDKAEQDFLADKIREDVDAEMGDLP